MSTAASAPSVPHPPPSHRPGVLRPPIANEHVLLLPDGLVRIKLKRPFRDGTVAVDMDPLSLLCRLAAAVPPPGQHQIRYAGVLAAAAKWRALVVPPPPPPSSEDTASPHPARPNTKPPTHRCGCHPWAQLLKGTFGLDRDTCPSCGGTMKLRAIVIAPASVTRFLTAIGQPSLPPPLAPARGPPYTQSPVFRRKPAAGIQVDPFDA